MLHHSQSHEVQLMDIKEEPNHVHHDDGSGHERSQERESDHHRVDAKTESKQEKHARNKSDSHASERVKTNPRAKTPSPPRGPLTHHEEEMEQKNKKMSRGADSKTGPGVSPTNKQKRKAAVGFGKTPHWKKLQNDEAWNKATEKLFRHLDTSRTGIISFDEIQFLVLSVNMEDPTPLSLTWETVAVQSGKLLRNISELHGKEEHELITITSDNLKAYLSSLKVPVESIMSVTALCDYTIGAWEQTVTGAEGRTMWEVAISRAFHATKFGGHFYKTLKSFLYLDANCLFLRRNIGIWALQSKDQTAENTSPTASVDGHQWKFAIELFLMFCAKFNYPNKFKTHADFLRDPIFSMLVNLLDHYVDLLSHLVVCATQVQEQYHTQFASTFSPSSSSLLLDALCQYTNEDSEREKEKSMMRRRGSAGRRFTLGGPAGLNPHKELSEHLRRLSREAPAALITTPDRKRSGSSTSIHANAESPVMLLSTPTGGRAGREHLLLNDSATTITSHHRQMSMSELDSLDELDEIIARAQWVDSGIRLGGEMDINDGTTSVDAIDGTQEMDGNEEPNGDGVDQRKRAAAWMKKEAPKNMIRSILLAPPHTVAQAFEQMLLLLTEEYLTKHPQSAPPFALWAQKAGLDHPVGSNGAYHHRPPVKKQQHSPQLAPMQKDTPHKDKKERKDKAKKEHVVDKDKIVVVSPLKKPTGMKQTQQQP